MTPIYALPYHEPDITTILILSAFILALNIINHVLDRLIYCGLIGQILLGILWGTPGLKWLMISEGTESVMANLGYLGLILLVYEGGLSTSFKSLKSNLSLSVGIACTGVGFPIAFSYVLLRLVDATPLQAFAAGAALCSTSLGTTFTVLETSGLISTRMGVVLASAAMMDDVVGLVMVQVVTKLGGASSSSFSSVTVIRPVFVSLALALTVPLVARFIAKPLTGWLNAKRVAGLPWKLEMLLSSSSWVLTIHTAILLGLVTGASYAGTSNLFAAYLAGAAISWWDSEVAHPNLSNKGVRNPVIADSKTANGNADGEGTTDFQTPAQEEATSGEEIFQRFYKPGLQRILRPFFFASIGFSIPIRQMFSGPVVWRGIVYTILMAIGKFICGAWLIRLPSWPLLLKWRTSQHPQSLEKPNETKALEPTLEPASTDNQVRIRADSGFNSTDAIRPESGLQPLATNDQLSSQDQDQDQDQRNSTVKISNISRPLRLSAKKSTHHTNKHVIKPTSKPLSLYPAAILGSAMISRGEIGFLISSLAQSTGIFRPNNNNKEQNEESEIFLVVTWAIILCTIIGPVSVGLMVRRMKRLEKVAVDNGVARGNVLGVWS